MPHSRRSSCRSRGASGGFGGRQVVHSEILCGSRPMIGSSGPPKSHLLAEVALPGVVGATIIELSGVPGCRTDNTTMSERLIPSRTRASGATALVVAIAVLAMSSASPAAQSTRAVEGSHDQAEAARAVAAVMAAARDLLRPTQTHAVVIRPIMVGLVWEPQRLTAGACEHAPVHSPTDVLGPRLLDLPPPVC